jgi:hypothetical protein
VGPLAVGVEASLLIGASHSEAAIVLAELFEDDVVALADEAPADGLGHAVVSTDS